MQSGCPLPHAKKEARAHLLHGLLILESEQSCELSKDGFAVHN